MKMIPFPKLNDKETIILLLLMMKQKTTTTLTMIKTKVEENNFDGNVCTFDVVVPR